MNHQPFLQVNNITKTYNNIAVVNNISFEQNAQDNVAIMGNSGSGKSSLLKIISGHLQTTNGTVFFDNKKVLGPEEKLLPGHQQIAYLSQHYELLNNYVVKDLIWFKCSLATEQANEIFELCNVQHLLLRKTNELSGGEKQRIALCMLLVQQPQLLLLDEPFSNLDFHHKSILKTVIGNVQQQLKTTVLLASHDPQDVLSWANKIVVLQNGSIVQQGTAKEIYFNPINQYVAELLGVYNILPLVWAQSFFAINKEIIFRPHQLSICSIDSAMCSAKVVNSQFYGNYYLIHLVVFDELNWILQHNHNHFNYGEIIGIELKLDENSL